MSTEALPFAAAVKTYQAAAWAVLNARQTWEQELINLNAPRVTWPIPVPATQAACFFRVLMLADIEVMSWLLSEEFSELAPAVPLDPADERLQRLLRVALRARTAGEQAVIERFGGDRITGRRNYQNTVNEQWVELAARYAREEHITKDQAFKFFGIPRRQAYRAGKRGVRRK